MWFKKKEEPKKEEKKICTECGHIFDFGGEKRKVNHRYLSSMYRLNFTFYTNDTETREAQIKEATSEWYCSLHIPAWDRKEYGTYYKEFEVNEDGTLIQPKRKYKKRNKKNK